MENMQLLAEPRTASKKGAARALRREGRIPAVLYGDGEPRSLSVDAKEWGTGFKNTSGSTIVQLKLGGKDHNVLIKDIQDDILTGLVRHIDFYAIHADKKLTTMVPVRLNGTPVGVREGGILEHKIEELEVNCLPKDIPESFTIDISELNVGESKHVGDLEVPDGVEIRTDSALTLVVITHAKAAVTETGEPEEADQEAAGETEEEAGS